MSQYPQIDYIEFPTTNAEASKTFFATVFGWTFTDYGSDYTAFNGAGIDGGFFRSETAARTDNGSALIVFYSDDLAATLKAVKNAGGTVVQDIFDFPGGQRFHFTEPGGSEFAVWCSSEKRA